MSGASAMTRLEDLRRALVDLDPSVPAAERLNLLIRSGLDRLPLPGSGATLERWRALVAVSATDLALAKLYEGHTDALAIFAELGVSTSDAGSVKSWGVWAAEAPEGRTSIDSGTGSPKDSVLLNGAKCWCSGAASASHALLTAWPTGGRGSQLVSVDLRQPGVRVSDTSWHAVGMAASASLDVTFDRVEATLVGEQGAYVTRPGFWQGGAGIAACWFGGSLAVADALRTALAQAKPESRSPFRMAALGRVDLALHATAALLRECAAWIDANPSCDASPVALRARLRAEQTATLTLDEVGRALGATPFCRDDRFARMAADLPVFIRQSHAERDLAALGERALEADPSSWLL